MDSSTLVVVLNTLAILGVAWKGGMILGALQKAVETLAIEVKGLREWRHDQGNLAARVGIVESEVERAQQDIEGLRERGTA